MKKLTKEQKLMIHGGKSISGIIQGVGAILYTASIIIGYVADYLLPSNEKKQNYDSKTFSNETSQKNSIFS